MLERSTAVHVGCPIEAFRELPILLLDVLYSFYELHPGKAPNSRPARLELGASGLRVQEPSGAPPTRSPTEVRMGRRGFRSQDRRTLIIVCSPRFKLTQTLIKPQTPELTQREFLAGCRTGPTNETAWGVGARRISDPACGGFGFRVLGLRMWE